MLVYFIVRLIISNARLAFLHNSTTCAAYFVIRNHNSEIFFITDSTDPLIRSREQRLNKLINYKLSFTTTSGEQYVGFHVTHGVSRCTTTVARHPQWH